jgi:hypothetical protein
MFLKIRDILKRFGVYLAIVASVIGIYGYFEAKFIQNTPLITITKNNVEHLTILPKADGLKAQFVFKDSVVKDLWKIRITIENSGSNSIIGKGYQKNIIDNSLRLLITRGYTLINTNLVKSSFPIKLESKSNEIKFSFDQWRAGEFAIFEVYADGSVYQGKSVPSILLDDRELINGKAVYKEVNELPTNKKTHLIDFIPKVISTIIYWFYVLTSGFVLIAMPFAIVEEYKKRNKYNLWMLVYKPDYDKEIQKLISDGVLNKYYAPLELNESDWMYFATPKIFVKAQPNVRSVVIGAIAVFMFFAVPLLWMIRIA